MSIIIETPQPPIRERLILVREGEPMAPRRDAEPADLERAGYQWVAPSRRIAAEAERDEARDTIARARGCITDVPAGVRNALDVEVARVVRERDEAVRSRDQARAALAAWQGSAEQERARIVADLRHDAEHLAWPIGTSPNEVLRGAADCIDAGWVRGEHAGTPATAPLPRATDEELVDVYLGAFRSSGPGDVETARCDGIAAVAARVRREQCLVTRAVEAGGIYIERTGHHGGKYWVEVGRGMHAPARNLVDAADVPATVERLLGEVTR